MDETHLPRLTFHTFTVPLWELLGNVGKLSLYAELALQPEESVGEHSEEEWASFELPEDPPTTDEATEALHSAIVSRTVVAAARGGHIEALRASYFGRENIDHPFAIRALLPCWLSIEH